MQLTLASPWADRSKLECWPWWQSRHFASTSLAVALAGLKILVGSALSAWALPAPWQFSQVTPFLPCICAILVCGLEANPLATSSWQVAQVSEPAKSEAVAVFPPDGGAAIAIAQQTMAPKMNARQARSAGHNRRAVPFADGAADRSVYMKNDRLA